jgi:DNA-binding transcriptional LysR family regulator
MEYFQVKYFLSLCDELNFTRAAARCNVSQPSLTRAIQGLEAELGGPLFHRERQNTHLTELGRTMRPYFEEVLTQSEAAKERARSFVKLSDAPLNVGVMCTIGPNKLLPLFKEFQSQYPGVDIAFRDARAGLLQNMLTEGELDVAIFGIPGEIHSRFHAMKLFDERFVIAFAPGHPFEALNDVRLADLHQQRYLARINCEFGDHMRALYGQRSIVPVRPYRSERDDWIQVMALSGLGFTFIPEFAITVAGLEVRPLIEPEVRRSISVITVRGRPHAPAVGAFVRTAMACRESL